MSNMVHAFIIDIISSEHFLFPIQTTISLNSIYRKKEHMSNKATISKWKMTSSAEKRNKGKAPAHDYSQDKRLPAEQTFIMHEGVSLRRNPRGSISL